MKTRQEIKAAAREAMAAQRGTAILLTLVVIGLSFVLSIASTALDAVVLLTTGMGALYWTVYFVGLIIIMVVPMVATINMIGQYIKIYKNETASVGAVFSEMQTNFWRKLGGYLWMTLFLTLWAFLFGIPVGIILYFMGMGQMFASDALLHDPVAMAGQMAGFTFVLIIAIYVPLIIKALAYFFTANVLADCPNVKATDAIKISMKITKGHRWAIFVFVLSFLGWFLLPMVAVVAFALLEFVGVAILAMLALFVFLIVYVTPYFYTADAGLYLELKNKALEDGVITYEDLGEEPPAEENKTDFFAIDESNEN